MVDMALHSLRQSNNLYIDEYNRRKQLEQQMAQVLESNRACAVLGIMPVTSLPELYRSN